MNAHYSDAAFFTVVFLFVGLFFAVLYAGFNAHYDYEHKKFRDRLKGRKDE